uniref:Uncharacterized protein n=1 Tax=Psilocybe cubensis TaxID=181762 RepID=A0A8H7XU16_PSICU
MIADRVISDSQSPQPSLPNYSLHNLEQPLANVTSDKGAIYADVVDRQTLETSESLNLQQSPPPSKESRRQKRKIKQANKLAFPGADDDETPLRQIGRGLLTIVVTPIAFAGMGIYAIGLIIEGTGTTLKGIGSIGRRAYALPRRKRQSKSESDESSS